MNKEIIPCEKIEQLYIKCFENKYCHQDKNEIYYTNMKIDCKTIQYLYKICIQNNKCFSK